MQRSILPLVAVSLVLLGFAVTGSTKGQNREATVDEVAETPAETVATDTDKMETVPVNTQGVFVQNRSSDSLRRSGHSALGSFHHQLRKPASQKTAAAESKDSTRNKPENAKQAAKKLRLQNYRFYRHYQLTISHDEKLLATWNNGAVGIWNAKTGLHVLWLKAILTRRNWYKGQREGHIQGVFGGYLSSIAFSKDGKSLITSGGDGTARVWNTSTGKETLVLESKQPQIWERLCPLDSAVFSPDGSLIATGGFCGNVEVWDAKSGTLRFTLGSATGKPAKGNPGNVPQDDQVISLDFSPDGKLLAAGGYYGRTRVLEIQTKKKKRHVLNSHKPGWFSPDGQFIVGRTRAGLVWNTNEFMPETVFKGMKTPLSYARQKSQTLLMSTTPAGSVRIFRVPSMKQIAKFPKKAPRQALLGATISPSGRILWACWKDGRMRGWNVNSGEELH